MQNTIFLKKETILGINEHVRLRREESNIIVYWAAPRHEIDAYTKTNISKLGTRRLPSQAAVILAFFDGKRSLKEVFQAVKYIWDKSHLTFNGFCKEIEKFILNIPPFNFEFPILIEVVKGKQQNVRCYDPETFVIKESKWDPSSEMRLKFPIEITIIPSMECFTDCVYCYMGPHPRYSPLPFSRWKELLKEMGKYQLSKLSFSGGDPMHYKHTMDMLEFASTFEPPTYLSIATKAYISPEIARRFANIPRFEILMSLDSTDPKIADAMTRRKGYGKRTIKSIENLIKAGIIPDVIAVLTPQTIKAMPQTILDLHNLGVHNIRVAAYIRSLWHHKDTLFNKADECEEFFKKVKKIEAKYGFRIQIEDSSFEGLGAPVQPKSFEERKKRWDLRSGCSVGKTILFILPDGTLLGCEQIPQIPEYFLGSVANKSIYDVWNSEDFKKKTYEIPCEKYKGTACYNCPEFEECHSASGKGYCMRESYKLWGTIYAPEPKCPYNNKELPRQW